MLVFIVPVKSRQIATSWAHVSRLFERCVRSLCNQTSPAFRVVVVCNERPEILFEHPAVSYVEVDFPAPIWKDDADFTTRELDKGKKIYTGLIHARQLNPSHIMLVDADDCVSKHLAKFVSQHPESSGWVMDKGYEYEDGSRFIYRKKNRFHWKCGTAHIIRFDLIEPLLNLPLEQLSWEHFYHKNIPQLAEKNNESLAFLPFEGAVYITDNRENIFYQKQRILKGFNFDLNRILRFQGRKLYERMTSQPLTDAICNEFGIYALK